MVSCTRNNGISKKSDINISSFGKSDNSSFPQITNAKQPEETIETPISLNKPDKGRIIEFEDESFKDLMLEALCFNAQLNDENAQTEIYEDDLAGIYSLEIGVGVNFLIELNSFHIKFIKKINGEDVSYFGNIWLNDGDYFNHNFISTLSDLQYFSELKELSLTAVMADDLSPVYQLSSLEELFIMSLFNVKDISGISQLKNLQRLDVIGWSFDLEEMYKADHEQAELADKLTKHNITECNYDVSFLSGLPQLTWLYIGGVNLDLSYISDLTRLKVLVINGNNGAAADLSYLKNMNDLQFLGLSHMLNTSNADALLKLKNLKYLNLQNTNIDQELRNTLNVRTDISYIDINGWPENYID